MKYTLIIGGGAAGLMAAIQARRAGEVVTVLEAGKKPAAKIYATGNGRCNFTNTDFSEGVFRGFHPEFADRAFHKFDNEALIAYFKTLGIFPRDINGYIYPFSLQASSVALALVRECEELGVNIYCDSPVIDIKIDEDGLKAVTENNIFRGDKMIITCGGKAGNASKLKTDMYKTLKKLGIGILRPMPALVNLKYSDKDLAVLAGVRARAGVRLLIDGNQVSAENGEIIFNKDNINGIPVMQLSRFAAYALNEKKSVTLKLDFASGFGESEFYDYLRGLFYGKESGHKNVYDLLSGLLNDKLLTVILKRSGINTNKAANKLKPQSLDDLVQTIRCFGIDIKQTGSFENAQVTAGGVSTEEIGDDMQSKIIPGMFFAGEIIDIDGTCGGYNLQWAFTSGYIAGGGK